MLQGRQTPSSGEGRVYLCFKNVHISTYFGVEMV